MTRHTTHFEDLAAALRVWAKGLLSTEAAVELLIGHRLWLYRDDFREIAVEFGLEAFSGRVMAAVDFEAVAGAVPLNVDLDVVLSVLAHTVCAALRRRLPGYATATPDTLQRWFLNTGGIIENDRRQTTIRLARRTYSPILRQASLPETITVPWWEGRTLRRKYSEVL